MKLSSTVKAAVADGSVGILKKASKGVVALSDLEHAETAPRTVRPPPAANEPTTTPFANSSHGIVRSASRSTRTVVLRYVGLPVVALLAIVRRLTQDSQRPAVPRCRKGKSSPGGPRRIPRSISRGSGATPIDRPRWRGRGGARWTANENAWASRAEPMNQKYVHDLADELAIYAYELRVSQADVPYVMQPGARAAGTKKLSLYVDDLTIDGDLVNLGQDITIVARAVHLTEQTVIDVGGADPAAHVCAWRPSRADGYRLRIARCSRRRCVAGPPVRERHARRRRAQTGPAATGPTGSVSPLANGSTASCRRRPSARQRRQPWPHCRSCSRCR